METTLNYKDTDLEVHYEFYKGEKQTYDYVGSADEVEISNIYHCGIDVTELLEDQVADIEDKLLETLND